MIDGRGALLGNEGPRPAAVDPISPDIVYASSELPAHPDALIRDPKPRIAPPDTKELRKMFDEARDMTAESRKKQQTDRDYYDGPEQLNSDVRATLKMRGQPAIYTNRVRPAIDGILGVLEASEADPRCYPRNPSKEGGDEDAADVASKTLRYVADKARFDELKLDCAENFLIEGNCAAIIEGDPDSVDVVQIRWEEFFADPRSRRHDYKDARYMGFAQWLSSEYVKGLYPEKWAEFGGVIDSGSMGIEATWEDRPEDVTRWVNSKERRVLVVTLFYQATKAPYAGEEWFRCVYCAAGTFDHDITGYVDSQGRSLNPMEAASCYVDRKNQRYGRVRDMVPIQDEINARRSRLLHLANSRQLQEREVGSAQVDADTARAEASRADGVIPPGWQLVPVSDLAGGQQLLLGESKNEIDRMGPTPAVLGRQDGANQSGRSRLVLQQAGMTELARPLGRFEDWENRCYRQMWYRAQQFFTEPMWIRTTDDMKTPEFLQVNEPIMGEGIVQVPVVVGGQPLTDPTGAPVMRSEIGQVQVGVKNRLADLDMDIIVETVPETANLQSETFAEFIEMVRSGTDPFSPQFELLVEMSPIQDKQRIVDRIKAFREESQQDPEKMQMMQALQEMQGKLAEYEGGEKAAGAAKSQADAVHKMAEAAKTEAETAEIAFNLGQQTGA